MKKSITFMIMIMFVLSTAVLAERTEDVEKEDETKKVETVEKEKKEKNTDETLFKGRHRNGGYGALMLKGMSINSSFGTLIGARGAWVVNKSLAIGGGGYALIGQGDIFDGFFEDSNEYRAEMAYGGLFIELIANSRKLLHVTLGTLIGAGVVAQNDRDNDYDGDRDEAEVFFVVEPEVSLMLNVSRNFRIGLNISYRHVAGVDCDWTSNSDLGGLGGGLVFKIGRF
ncbi:MAG: hypothetical protein GY757_62095 [bacterium]|nr:hypothetical protein [bacterium]